MKSFFFSISDHLRKFASDITESLHPFEPHQDNIVILVHHDMTGMQISEKVATFMHELQAS